MNSRRALDFLLGKWFAKGKLTFAAQEVAHELWPDARGVNVNGQTFNLASGVAGRMLSKHRCCSKLPNGLYQLCGIFRQAEPEYE